MCITCMKQIKAHDILLQLDEHQHRGQYRDHAGLNCPNWGLLCCRKCDILFDTTEDIIFHWDHCIAPGIDTEPAVAAPLETIYVATVLPDKDLSDVHMYSEHSDASKGQHLLIIKDHKRIAASEFIALPHRLPITQRSGWSMSNDDFFFFFYGRLQFGVRTRNYPRKSSMPLSSIQALRQLLCYGKHMETGWMRLKLNMAKRYKMHDSLDMLWKLLSSSEDSNLS